MHDPCTETNVVRGRLPQYPPEQRPLQRYSARNWGRRWIAAVIAVWQHEGFFFPY